MKRYLVLFLIATVVLFVPAMTYALGFSQSLSFGGKVLTVNFPGVVCNGGYGPITIVPNGLFPPGPYAVDFNTKRFSTGVIRTGNYILGLYNPVISFSVCHTTTIPPVPIPAFVIKLFGSS